MNFNRTKNAIIATGPPALITNIPIDQELVVNAKEGIFELSNGCICCSLNVELGELLQKLASEEYHFDHLIIETTGIAEPDGIASAFIGGNRGSTFILDGTICLADAHDIRINLKERGEAGKQISFADAIVLNKIDLVAKEELQEAEKVIRTYNADARIFHAKKSVVKEDLLNLQAYDGNRLENMLMNPHHSHHHNALAAHSFELKDPLNAEKFEHWITMLLFLSGYQIYRIKGVLSFNEESHKIIFQSVRSNSTIEIGSPWQEGEVRKSKIVFIATRVERKVLEKGLSGCLVRG